MELRLYLLMVLGMYSFQVYSNLTKQEDSDAPVQIKAILLLSIRQANFYIALVVSPIIFYIAQPFFDKTTNSEMQFLISFYAGFFWNYFFNNVKKGLEKKGGKDSKGPEK
jgi:hypothetical protein